MAYTDLEYKFKKIGKNVEIGRNVYFRYPDEVEIGDNVIIDEFCYFTTKLKIENNVHIAPFCSVIGGKTSEFTIKQYSTMAAGVRIICATDDFVNGPFTNPTVPLHFRPNTIIGKVVLERHVIVGTNAVIMPNVIVGEGNAIGAMTFVRESTEPWKVYVGVPARMIRDRNKESVLRGENEYECFVKENGNGIY